MTDYATEIISEKENDVDEKLLASPADRLVQNVTATKQDKHDSKKINVASGNAALAQQFSVGEAHSEPAPRSNTATVNTPPLMAKANKSTHSNRAYSSTSSTDSHVSHSLKTDNKADNDQPSSASHMDTKNQQKNDVKSESDPAIQRSNRIAQLQQALAYLQTMEGPPPFDTLFESSRHANDDELLAVAQALSNEVLHQTGDMRRQARKVLDTTLKKHSGHPLAAMLLLRLGAWVASTSSASVPAAPQAEL